MKMTVNINNGRSCGMRRGTGSTAEQCKWLKSYQSEHWVSVDIDYWIQYVECGGVRIRAAVLSRSAAASSRSPGQSALCGAHSRRRCTPGLDLRYSSAGKVKPGYAAHAARAQHGALVPREYVAGSVRTRAAAALCRTHTRTRALCPSLQTDSADVARYVSSRAATRCEPAWLEAIRVASALRPRLLKTLSTHRIGAL
jgi:hypothetical protein